MPENPLAALGPIAWDSLDCNDLDGFLGETFACAQIIADSVPTVAPTPAATTSTGRPRSQTDGAVSYNPGKIWGWGGAAPNPAAATATDDGLPGTREKKLNELRQSWKEVKTGGANPRAVTVYKMNGGREGYAGSSWFARRSLHKRDSEAAFQLDFETFKRGLLHEFDLSVPRHGKPKPVRTMVTRKRVEHVRKAVNANANANAKANAESEQELQIFLLEADFPGPTASRDFVTMLLTTESTVPSMTGPCKQFMMVSKPCQHRETPTRSGFVRAQYESVEMIREVPIPKAEAQSLASPAGRRTRSSVDLGRSSFEEGEDHAHHDTHEMAIEWIMITRNNPGGNVPRFLVDKNTPSSIISDANKFLDWLVAKRWADGKDVKVQDVKGKDAAKVVQTTKQRGAAPGTATSLSGLGDAIHEEEEEEAREAKRAAAVNGSVVESTATENDIPSIRGGAASSTRLFNMFAGALGGASTVVVSKLPNPFEGAVQVIYPEIGVACIKEDDANEDESDMSDDGLDDSDSDDTGGDSYSDIEQSEESTADKGLHQVADTEPVRTRSSTLDSISEGEHSAAAAAAGAGTATLSIDSDCADNSTKSTSNLLENTPEPDNDSKSISSKTRSVGNNSSNSNKTKEKEKELEKAEKKERNAERNAQKLLEKHNKAVARREAQFQKELQKLEQKRRQQADKEAARLQKKIASTEKSDKDKGGKDGKDGKDGKEGAPTKKIAGLLEYTQRELERAAAQIESLQKEVRELQAENRRLKEAEKTN